MQTEKERIDNRIAQTLDATQHPDKWKNYKKQQLKTVSGKLDNIQKSEQFADYLNARFMDAAIICGAQKLSTCWKNIPSDSKIAFAQQIVDTLLSLLYQDIQNNRITIYNTDGSIYKKTNNDTDKLYKNDITSRIYDSINNTSTNFITITKSECGLMGISRNGKLAINTNWELYKSIIVFLMDLRHEMMHVIDIFVPQISTLNPETRKIALNCYIYGNNNSDFELYKNNPLELNANLKRREFRQLCSERLVNINQIKTQQLSCINIRAN